jgi:hypothetical protein
LILGKKVNRDCSEVKRVKETIHHGLGVEGEMELVPKGSIGRVLFKAQRVITAYHSHPLP